MLIYKILRKSKYVVRNMNIANNNFLGIFIKNVKLMDTYIDINYYIYIN